jgi:hypothetical protein
MNYWVVLLLLYLVLGIILYLKYDHALSLLLDYLLFMRKSLFNRNMERPPEQTVLLEWWNMMPLVD